MGRLILIEGMDLAGKTTLARELARELGANLSRNCLLPHNQVAQEADRMRRDPNRNRVVNAQLFLAAHLYDAAHFACPENGHVQDSWWLRTLAWEMDCERLWAVESLREMSVTFPRFDAILYLTASIECRRDRYHMRAENDHGDHLVYSDPERFMRLDRTLATLTRHEGAFMLDTSRMTPQQVLTWAMGRVSSSRYPR